MQIVDRPAATIVGIEVVAPVSDLPVVVPQAWARVFARRRRGRAAGVAARRVESGQGSGRPVPAPPASGRRDEDRRQLRGHVPVGAGERPAPRPAQDRCRLPRRPQRPHAELLSLSASWNGTTRTPVNSRWPMGSAKASASWRQRKTGSSQMRGLLNNGLRLS